MDTVTFIMEGASRTPLLTAEQELMLGRQVQAWVAIRDTPDPTPEQKRIIRLGRKAYDRFYMSNIKLCIKVAKKYTRVTKTLSYEDLIQEGCIGLSRAIIKFDVERGYKFSTYAYWWIRQGVVRSINTSDRTIRLPASASDSVAKMNTYANSYKEKHGHKPTIAECAKHVKLSESQARLLLMRQSDTISLDQPFGKSSEAPTSFADIIPCDRDTPWEIAEEEDRQQLLRDLLKKIPPSQVAVLTSSWGLDGSEPMSFSKMAELQIPEGEEGHLYCTRRQLSAIHQQAMTQLKKAAA